MSGFDNNKRRLALAVGAALMVHAWVISWSIYLPQTPPVEVTASLSANVVIDPSPTQPPEREEIEEILPNPTEPEAQPVVIPPVVLTTKPEDVAQSNTTVRLQTSVISSQFKSFLRAETKQHMLDHQAAVKDFSLTFDSVYEADESATEISNEMLPRGSGVFMTTVNGKRLCGAKIVQMLSGDGLGSDIEGSFLTRECAPKQTFELDMNKPNNG